MGRSVIFDVGNVLVRWDPKLLYAKLLPDDAAIEAFFEEIDIEAFNREQDRGRTWEDGVEEASRRFPHRAALIEAFHHRWHECAPHAIEGSVELLRSLATQGTPLYAITNFSAQKWAECLERFEFLKNSFRDVIVSAHERIVKPDPEIYRRCLSRNGLDAADSVFIDDSEANIAAARALGIDAIHFVGPEALRVALVERDLL